LCITLFNSDVKVTSKAANAKISEISIGKSMETKAGAASHTRAWLGEPMKGNEKPVAGRSHDGF